MGKPLDVGLMFGACLSFAGEEGIQLARHAPVCGAMLANETLQGLGGTDFNGDGDRTDIVLRWFAF